MTGKERDVAGRDGRSAYDRRHPARAQVHAALSFIFAALAFSAVANAPEEDDGYVVQTDTVFLRAGAARQSDDRRGFELSGGLYMRGSRWDLRAERAVIEGTLNDPERIEVEGEPAAITVRREAGSLPVQGYSRHLEFEPERQELRLHGSATIVHDRQSIRSESIRYLIDREAFAAGGDVGRVQVTTTPRKD